MAVFTLTKRQNGAREQGKKHRCLYPLGIAEGGWVADNIQLPVLMTLYSARLGLPISNYQSLPLSRPLP